MNADNTPMKVELGECPFCGGKAEIVTRDVEPQYDYWHTGKRETFIECKQCNTSMFDSDFHEGFYENDLGPAYKKWNHRAPSKRELELERAARTLIAKIDLIHNDLEYQAIWELAFAHYGHNYTKEFAALKALTVENAIQAKGANE